MENVPTYITSFFCSQLRWTSNFPEHPFSPSWFLVDTTYRMKLSCFPTNCEVGSSFRLPSSSYHRKMRAGHDFSSAIQINQTLVKKLFGCRHYCDKHQAWFRRTQRCINPGSKRNWKLLVSSFWQVGLFDWLESLSFPAGVTLQLPCTTTVYGGGITFVNLVFGTGAHK